MWLWMACAPALEPQPPDALDTAPVAPVLPTTSPHPSDSGLVPTDTATPSANLSATCTLTPDNALRAWCDVTVHPPQPVQVRFAKAGGGPERVHRSDVVAADHRVPLYLMAPNTEYAWVAEATDDPLLGLATGALQTQPLPVEARITYDVTGSATTDYVLHSSPCNATPTIHVASAEGEVLWYQSFPAPPSIPMVDATSVTERGVLALHRERLIEFDWMGQPLLDLAIGAHFPHALHHDAVRANGLTYALFHEMVFGGEAPVLVDGFFVFDDTGALVATWRLTDHHTPVIQQSAFGTDYSHANAIWIGDDGDALISFRHLSAVVKVAADPLAADFGEVRWVLAGDAEEQLWEGDFSLSTRVAGPADFLQQHNPFLLADGRLALFDNRANPREPSRVLHLRLNEASGEAEIDEAYPMALHCPFQGSAWHTSAGNPIGTCAPARAATEFDAATGAAVWSLAARCANGPSSYVPRFTPVSP